MRPDQASVTVRIYDSKGALIKELLHEAQTAGRHQLTWDGADSSGMRAASGVYFCAVEWGNVTRSRNLILVK
jgi:flagellar hook assembly protein FlgD